MLLPKAAARGRRARLPVAGAVDLRERDHTGRATLDAARFRALPEDATLVDEVCSAADASMYEIKARAALAQLREEPAPVG